MNRGAIRSGIAIAGIGVLAAVPTAFATKPDDPGSQGHSKSGTHGNPTVSYVFKGTYAGDGSVVVTKGNAHVKKAHLVGETVSFDLANARIVVADTNADGVKDVNDVATDDKVVVKARLPKKDPGEQPFAAKQLVDQTHSGDTSSD